MVGEAVHMCGQGYSWEIFVSSTYFCCESKTAQKIKVYFLKSPNNHIQFIAFDWILVFKKTAL